MRILTWQRAGSLAAVLLLTAVFTRPAAAQSGTVQGRVTDSSGTAIIGATVTVEATSLRSNASARGSYLLYGVPTGNRVLRVRSLGFVPESLAVNVLPGQITRFDVVMRRTTTQLAMVNVVVGSHARHSAAEELAVPVDVFTTEDIQRTGTTETSQVLATLSPSVNFPKQAVTDATEIVRPFTLRGLSPDHSLVLINGVRRHQTALLNVFSNGSAPGSSGVDLNAFPSSAVDRIEVLRDGASTQYGSDAIAGVVNLVLKEGQFNPFVNASVGQYRPGGVYQNDGTAIDVNGGVGLGLGRGSLALFAQVLDRKATNRACPDGSFPDINGVSDSVANCRVVIKRTGVPQPNVHWGDGLEHDTHTFANLKLPLNAAGTTELYGFGGYSKRDGTGNGYFRKPTNSRNWPQIYPLGFLPEFRPKVIDYSAAGGIRSAAMGWNTDLGLSYGFNSFDFKLRNTLNSSLGPSLSTPTAPGPDGILYTADDPNIPNQTSFNAGGLRRGEFDATANASRLMDVGLPNDLNVAVGVAFRRESYEVLAGERASWINGYHLTADSSAVAQGGSSVFQGFAPTDASKHDRNNVGAYVDLETNLTTSLLANAAGRFEKYSDFGNKVTGKLAARLQATPEFVIRGAASTGFRAPGLAQSWYSHTTTAIQNNVLVEIGNFPVANRASRIFGSKPLKAETSTNFSAGIAYSPLKTLNMTVDIYRIAIKDRILLGATFDGSTDPAIAKILTDSGLTQIAGVQFPTNAADTKTNGLDVAANLQLPTWRGTLDLTGVFNYTKNTVTRIDPLPKILNGTGTLLTSALDALTINAIERNRPNERAALTANYSAGRFRAMGRSSYYGDFWDGSSDGIERFGAKTIFDAELGYRFNGVAVAVGSNNVFNTYPDRITLDVNSNNGTFTYPGSSPYGYNGRYVYVRTEITLSK